MDASPPGPSKAVPFVPSGGAYLAERIGISEVYAEKTPEEKVTIVREETRNARTLYVGDGINDAPALMSATVGVAIGQNSDITTESAGVVSWTAHWKKSTSSCT